jgi:hypothetical protein
MKAPKFIKVGDNDFFAIHFNENKIYHAKIDIEKKSVKAQIMNGDEEISYLMLYPFEAITAGEFQCVYSEAIEKLSNETPYN